MSLLGFLIEFLKIGTFTYGGGLAMIPLLREIAINHSWITDQSFTDMIAISQSTPGAIAINLATFIGYNQHRYLGAVLASLVVVLPGLAMVIFVSKFLDRFNNNKLVISVIYTLKAAAVGLVATAIVQIMKTSLFKNQSIDFKAVLLFIISYFFIKKTNWHPLIYILLGGGISLLIW